MRRSIPEGPPLIVKTRKATEGELAVTMAGLFAGGIMIGAGILNWVPDYAINSTLVLGFLLETFFWTFLMLLPDGSWRRVRLRRR